MLNKILKIKDTIDVFVSETESPEKVLIIFHKMTTRDRIELLAGKAVAEFLALLNGKDTTLVVLQKMGNFDEIAALDLLKYLDQQHLIVEVTNEIKISQRYKRQIAYFDDLVLDRPGDKTQEKLARKTVVILGCGSVGSAIAEILARVGILNFILIDYKNITKKNISSHTFAITHDIGKSKPQALADYLKKINKNIVVTIQYEMLITTTDLSRWIPNNADLVINSCDEPYIGHTSLKVGRYLHPRNIALYVVGGFDAHLMSSGELIYPPHTPCIDCTQKTFTKALGAWQPTYSAVESVGVSADISLNLSSNDYIAGGPGGGVVMSSFSANLGALRILEFLSEDSTIDYGTIRYEYLINSGVMTEFEMLKQEQCRVCNN